jgi:hypothetical protein
VGAESPNAEERPAEAGQTARFGGSSSPGFPSLPAIGAALLALALFAVTLGGTYVYDDFDVFQLDNRLRDPSQWGRYWTESYNGGVDNLYRPLVSMTYAVQWWLHGADARIDESDAWKYHLVNVLLHAGVSALVAELARRLMHLRAAWVAGLLFAAHPLHVEPVANIVGRAELMCAAGVVGALVLMLKPLTTLRAIAITGCFLVALLSKEQGMLTPLLLLVIGWTTRTRAALPRLLPAERTGSRPVRLLIILLTWTLAAYIVFRERILKFWWDRSLLDWTINPLVRPDADRWTMPLALLGRYASLLGAPWKLSPDYGATVIGWTVRPTDPYFYVGLLASIVWVAWLIVSLRRRDRATVFCLLALALTYGVVSNFPILIGVNFAERLMYLPSAFFVILVAALLARLPRKVLVPLLALALALACVRSFTYARRWNDRERFYQASLRQQPGSIRLYLLLTSEYLSQGRSDDAARLAAEASRQLPDYWEVWIARANVAMERGDFAEAERLLLRAMETPRAPTARVARWMMLLEQRRSATRPSTSGAVSPD